VLETAVRGGCSGANACQKAPLSSYNGAQMIHIVNKGKQGEREVKDAMNYCVYLAMQELGYPKEECLKGMSMIQRNQIQTAIGGADLTSCFGLSIEVKRQEALTIGTWWKQCEASAKRDNNTPVLIYRQNHKAWRVRTYAWAPLPNGHQIQILAEMDWESFRVWFKEWVKADLQK